MLTRCLTCVCVGGGGGCRNFMLCFGFRFDQLKLKLLMKNFFRFDHHKLPPRPIWNLSTLTLRRLPWLYTWRLPYCLLQILRWMVVGQGRILSIFTSVVKNLSTDNSSLWYLFSINSKQLKFVPTLHGESVVLTVPWSVQQNIKEWKYPTFWLVWVVIVKWWPSALSNVISPTTLYHPPKR